MKNNNGIPVLGLELSQREARYILYALDELMKKLEAEIARDPEADEEITPMYAEDVLHLRDIRIKLREKAVAAFGEKGLNVSYDTL